MSDILTGLAIGLGIIGGIVFSILTLVLAVLLFAEAQTRRKQRKEKPAKPAPVMLETLTDDQLRSRIRETANELDLWLRAASLRDVDVDLQVAHVTKDAIYPRGRYSISVKA